MKRFELAIDLLEDLHSGTGRSRGAADAEQFRDRRGRPAVPHSVLTGQLRATAYLIERRRVDPGLFAPGTTERLFGTDSRENVAAQFSRPPRRRAMFVGTARALGESLSGDTTLPVYGAAARERDDRRSLTDTLRFAEVTPAGTRFRAHCYLGADDQARLELLLRARGSLGADLTRGSGRYRWALTESPPPTVTVTMGPSFKLLLRADEPLQFPTSPAPGNLVDSLPYPPGSTLWGALLDEALTARPDSPGPLADALIKGKIRCSHAYPCPEVGDDELASLKCRFGGLEIRPAPLSRRQSKPRATSLFEPAWADDAGGRLGLVDLCDAAFESNFDATTKRLPADCLEWRVRDGRLGPSRWSLFPTDRSSRQRLRKPRRGKPASEQDLFTVVEVPEDTWMVAEIDASLADATAIGALRERLASGWPLWLGRGKRPVTVVAVSDATDPYALQADQSIKKLRITLASDLILRGPKLAFVDRLDFAAVGWLLEQGGSVVPDLANVRAEEPVFETVHVGGFNVMSGYPRATALALRRGSTMLLSTSEPDAAGGQALAALARALASRFAWGERVEHGYGRIHVEVEPQGADWSVGASTDGVPLTSPAERLAEAGRDVANHLRQGFGALPRGVVHALALLAKARLGTKDFELAVADLLSPGTAGLATQVLELLRQVGANGASLQAADVLREACRWHLALRGRDERGNSSESSR